MGTITGGELREVLVIQENAWPAIAVGLTRAGTTATATAAAAHNRATGDYVTIAGATPTGYNGRFQITVTGALTFTFSVDGALATPATGTVTAQFYSDSQGGRGENWVTKTTIRGELLPIGVNERLQLQAITAQTAMRFRVRRRGDLTPKMRVSWRPTWPPSSTTRTLEIHGVLPEQNGTVTMFVDCGVLD
jgi:head-tail adaptor